MKRLLSVLLTAVMITSVFLIAVPVSASKIVFSDVENGRWSASAIEYAVDNGYMNGVGGGRFDPEGSLTRAMVATVLWRREGSPAPTAPSGFSDVPAGEWYTDAVAWAKETGVVKGLTETTFGPDENITREQLATMLFRFSSAAPVSVPERADLTPFADDEKVSDWADEPLEWAVEAGLLKGTDGNRLDPEGDATREQFAAIIERYDGSFKLKYNAPVLRSRHTEKEYPLVTDADFYVSPTGDDSADGSLSHPFRTWEGARDAVRALDKTGRDGITVAFTAGNYGPLSLTMTAEDSGTETCPITYCAYGDGDVIFDNGFTVSESEFVPLDGEDKGLFTEKNAESIMKADVSSRLNDYDPVSTLIFSEDGMCTLARYPNLYEDGSDNLMRMAHTYDDHHIAVDLGLMIRKIGKYHTTDGLIFYGYITLGWYKDYVPTDGVTTDPETGDLVFHTPHPENTRGGHLRFEEWFPVDFYQMAIVNISEELDSKGEYWIDPETKTLYVYSPSGDYSFTGGDSVMLRLIDTDHIALRGLTFRNSGQNMLVADDSADVVINGCTFTCGAGDYLCDFERGKDIRVSDSVFSYAARTALDISGTKGNERYYIDTGIRIDNNLFTRTGLVIGNSGALAIGRTSDTKITHNEFVRCCWEGVDFRGACNMIAEYNVFDEVCCNGDDTGALNNWASFNMCGNVIRHNLFLNITGGTNGRFCAYLDNSAGTEMYSNLYYNCDCPEMNHDICYYNTFVDNVMIYGASGPTCNTYLMELVEEAAAAGDLSLITDHEFYNTWKQCFESFDADPELKAILTERWPGYFDITTDLSRIGDPEFCLNNSITVTGNRSINKDGSAGSYSDNIRKYSVIEDNLGIPDCENPLFVNPTRGDYRLKEGVDFPDVQFESIGRY